MQINLSYGFQDKSEIKHQEFKRRYLHALNTLSIYCAEFCEAQQRKIYIGLLSVQAKKYQRNSAILLFLTVLLILFTSGQTQNLAGFLGLIVLIIVSFLLNFKSKEIKHQQVLSHITTTNLVTLIRDFQSTGALDSTLIEFAKKFASWSEVHGLEDDDDFLESELFLLEEIQAQIYHDMYSDNQASLEIRPSGYLGSKKYSFLNI